MKTALLSLPLAFLMSAGVATAATAVYNVTFTGTWSTAKNPTRPGSAHFTTLVGATHNDSIAFWAPGQSATAGIESVAELGATGGFQSEIATAQGLGSADQLILEAGDGFINAEESFSFQLTVDSNHSLVTLVTMIAPSADWFVGLRDYDLIDGDNNWISTSTLNLNSYDAGTESGTDFALSGPTHVDTDDVIQRLDIAEPTGPLAASGSIATVQFDLVSADNIPEPSSTALLGLGALAGILRRRR